LAYIVRTSIWNSRKRPEGFRVEAVPRTAIEKHGTSYHDLCLLSSYGTPGGGVDHLSWRIDLPIPQNRGRKGSLHVDNGYWRPMPVMAILVVVSTLLLCGEYTTNADDHGEVWQGLSRASEKN
jgi:hypothetical protein